MLLDACVVFCEQRQAVLNRVLARAGKLGARLLLNRSDDQEEPLRVYADLAGHPFGIFGSSPPAV